MTGIDDGQWQWQWQWQWQTSAIVLKVLRTSITSSDA
jgi:hypothetical protein